MNYFDLFGIPLSFQPDQQLLKKKYAELSRSSHETSTVGASVTGLDEVAHHSSQVSKAYQVLQDQELTMEYILQVKQLLREGESYEPDPQFLMEVMDINEELMELELDEHKEQLMNVEQKANRLIVKTYDDVAPVMESYQDGTTPEEALLQVKQFYHQKKYLQGILDRIAGIRNIASPS